jgi:hypothetical protein
MSEYAKSQLAIALKTLPWYLGIPAVLVLPIGGSFYVAGADAKWMWRTVEIAAASGLFVWAVRQSIRILWTLRVLSTNREG